MNGIDVEPLRIRKFEVGDFVFAKLKGYPPWPSKINQIESTVSGGKETVRYNVFFYGTHQSSILRSSCLYHYDAYAKSIVEKWGRRPKFHEALEELEREMMTKIAYLKELRNIPDASWGPSFTNACDGLLSEIQESNVQDTRVSKTKEQSFKSSPIKKRVTNEIDSEWDEESRARGHKILYIERIPFPDCPESFFEVSLKFHEDWVRKEAIRIEEEERMMNCHVRIEPFPQEYRHLIINDKDASLECSVDPVSPTLPQVNDFWDDGSTIPQRVLRHPRKVERKIFHLSRRKKIKAALKVQERAAIRKTYHSASVSRRGRKGRRKRRKPSEDSDSDSVMETCPVCRLCFFSRKELMDHENSKHGNAKVSYSVNATINDADSETDIIFDAVKPVSRNSLKEDNLTRSEIVISDEPDWLLNKQTVFLKEGYPVDSLTTVS